MVEGVEEPIVFPCGGDQLIGVLHRPSDTCATGVVVVTGGPQYRAGSHRQSLLLGRHLAEAGFPVFRFDLRGMGDSEGEFVGFEGVNDDIRAAIDCLFDNMEGLSRVVLWGLCDGASAAAFYVSRDSRVDGLMLVNPWVRTEATVAHARMKGYYGGRLLSRNFWARLVRREVDVKASIQGLWRGLKAMLESSHAAETASDLPGRVAHCLRGYEGRALVIMSGADLTAKEFETAVLGSPAMTAWQRDPRVTLRRLGDANHTYSSIFWRNQVHDWALEWLRKSS